MTSLLHHATKLVIAANGLDAHPIEHIIINLGSIGIPYLILGMSNTWLLFYVSYVGFSAASSHSGYKHSKLHNLHHQLHNVNYGTGIYFMDYVFNTLKN